MMMAAARRRWLTRCALARGCARIPAREERRPAANGKSGIGSAMLVGMFASAPKTAPRENLPHRAMCVWRVRHASADRVREKSFRAAHRASASWYEPYGEVTSTGTSDNSYQYTGRENDGNGLYYYRARYYSQSLKRFISEDPMGLAAGLNSYSYVHDDPLNRFDPMGSGRHGMHVRFHVMQFLTGSVRSLPSTFRRCRNGFWRRFFDSDSR